MSDRRSPVLIAEDLRIETRSGVDIVDNISFAVHRGEVLALVGESGCGKTSTALALLGHARPGTRIAAGSVRLEGRDLLQLDRTTMRRTRGAQIAYVPQDPAASLNPRQRIGRQVSEVLAVHGAKHSATTASMTDLLRGVGLPGDQAFLRRYPFELSGGQQQRVVIAMALVCGPRVVVLDEPTTGLDVTTQARVLALLRDLCRSTGSAFIYVTHDLAVVDAIADRVLVMYAGRIIEEGTRATMLHRPAHPYSALLLSSVPRLAVRRLLTGISGTAPDPRSRPAGCSFAPRCPIASDVCLSTFPSVTRIGPQQLVRCWHAGQPVAPAPIYLPPPSPAVARATPLLEVKHLSAGYSGALQRPVVRNISFRLGEGECLALIGESGSGKSTIGRCVVGLHRPSAGEVLLRGAVLSAHASQRLQAERRAIQLIFQNPDRSLNPNETIGEAIRRPLRLFDLADRGTEWAHATEMLERVRLPGSMLHRYPRELSGGEKQRVAIARALAAKPDLLVCDEITSSLDVSTQAAIVALLSQLKESGLALLFITHNLALVRSFADQILVLESGDVREIGSASQVIDYPMHPYTRELVAAAPDIKER